MMVNLYLLEYERKAREAELQHYLTHSVLLQEAKKLDQHLSMRERVALLLIVTAERLAPAVSTAHLRRPTHVTVAHSC